MTEEEYFRKTYPNYCYGDRPLSPYWDTFQDGVEFGERQSEKKIEELEQENNKLLDVINNQDVKIADLEKQIEKMKCCLNCEHHFKNGLHYICCNLRELRQEPITDVNVCNKWEKEKEYL